MAYQIPETESNLRLKFSFDQIKPRLILRRHRLFYPLKIFVASAAVRHTIKLGAFMPGDAAFLSSALTLSQTPSFGSALMPS